MVYVYMYVHVYIPPTCTLYVHYTKLLWNAHAKDRMYQELFVLLENFLSGQAFGQVILILRGLHVLIYNGIPPMSVSN